LDRLKETGIQAVRYPVLWERTAPNGVDSADWSWADERLYRLKDLGIQPIVTLVHHGSGPRYTSLVDPDFPKKLAEFAQSVAERYPWVDAYTPVNEPLTTARFSGLYGHWYPHGKDDQTFLECLLNECQGTVEAMRVIRQINPDAEFIMTEDFGRTYSTKKLAYQAEMENERRCFSFDLFCGRVEKDTVLWDYMAKNGIPMERVRWFEDNPCPPDVMGINYYLTSDRYLDEQLDFYPACHHGGNGHDDYADVEAVRTPVGISGHLALLERLWERYHIPLAITEAHLGCTREEQLRWLDEAWQALCKLSDEGVDIRALTAWSFFGAYDWNSLVTVQNGFYEPGIFDLRSKEPRPTVLSHYLKTISEGDNFEHPVLDVSGWWSRPERQIFPRVPIPSFDISKRDDLANYRPVIITGGTGTLGQAFAKICDIRGIPYFLTTRDILDIAESDSVNALLERLNPWAVINTAGYVRVDDAESEADRCYRENTEGPANLAAACKRYGTRLVTFSSDLVFDGHATAPYTENSTTSPLCVYGDSKARAESLVLGTLADALVIRTSAFFGPWDEFNFVTVALKRLAAGQEFVAADDVLISPTYVPDLVHMTLDLLIDGASGLWHLSNQSAISWLELARQAASMADVDTSRLVSCQHCALGLPAQRPAYSVLGSEHGIYMPSLENALMRYFAERKLQDADLYLTTTRMEDSCING
jgi:dTDP-4-dehydrorhamnose reductase